MATSPRHSADTEGWSFHPLAQTIATQRGRPLAVIIVAAVVLLQIIVGETGFNRIGQSLLDFYHRMSPRQVENLPVVIVDIDEKTLEAQGQWPWPRTRLADLIGKVGEAGPLAIGLDIIMPEADRLSPERFGTSQQGLSAQTRAELSALPST